MCIFFLYTVDFTLPSSFLVNLVQALVSVRLLSVHGGLHTSIFLSGELGIQEGHTAVFLKTMPEDLQCSYVVAIALPFLCEPGR